jgi:hypothetical protein
MFVVDDPALALIARFVGGDSRLDLSNPEFLSQQLAAIQAYVQRFPEHERETRALEWIEENARRYRQAWQRRTACEALTSVRCPDCPLTGAGVRTSCEIHARWLALLQGYAADELSSHEYVEKTLALLRAHKDRLTVGHAPGPIRNGARVALAHGR